MISTLQDPSPRGLDALAIGSVAPEYTAGQECRGLQIPRITGQERAITVRNQTIALLS